MLAPATPTISGFTAREMPQVPTPERVGGVTETTNCVGDEGLRPLRTPVNGGTPPLKFPPYSLFRPKGGRKTINFFTHFLGFVPDTNYKHLECFVMLGTLSEPRRGRMSHICDISALRVNAYEVKYWIWQETYTPCSNHTQEH